MGHTGDQKSVAGIREARVDAGNGGAGAGARSSGAQSGGEAQGGAAGAGVERRVKIVRGRIVHTPESPFETGGALKSYPDGAVAVEAGRIAALGAYRELASEFPDAPVVDWSGAWIFPGMVDAHVHFPQVHVIGGMGLSLLDWLERRALPEECRLADPEYARGIARSFLSALLRNGTTAALVFGAHFAAAQEVLFEEAEKSGLFIASGLVLSDRLLAPELHTTPERAYEESKRLVDRWHGRGRLRYAVTPRFALSASEGILEVARSLMDEVPGAWFQTHLNETKGEIEAVASLFPDARDYLDVYERFELVRDRSVFAHNVHSRDRELDALAASRAWVAHCPSSNAGLGSGLFPMTRHVRRGVRIALGSDVGAGAGFSLFHEGLMAYQTQMLREDGYALKPAHLLYLVSRAGALALGIDGEAGDLTPGKRADLVVVRPPHGSTLEALLARCESEEEALALVFTLAREESVAAVYLAGEIAYRR